MLTLILKDGTNVSLADFSTGDFIVLCENFAVFSNTLANFTDENLESMQIVSDGSVIQNLSNVVFTGAQAVVNPDKTVTGHYYYRAEYTENEMVTAARILLGEEV